MAQDRILLVNLLLVKNSNNGLYQLKVDLMAKAVNNVSASTFSLYNPLFALHADAEQH